MGSRVSEEALRTGLAVVSISRSGVPPKGVSAPWVSKVKWAKVRLGGARGTTEQTGSFLREDNMTQDQGARI